MWELLIQTVFTEAMTVSNISKVIWVPVTCSGGCQGILSAADPAAPCLKKGQKDQKQNLHISWGGEGGEYY